MDRKEELLNIIKADATNQIILKCLVDEIIFLEQELAELRKDNFIKKHPENPSLKRKDKDAIKQYKEFLQQYTNCLKTLNRLTNDDGETEESPLRKWMRNKVGDIPCDN